MDNFIYIVLHGCKETKPEAKKHFELTISSLFPCFSILPSQKPRICFLFASSSDCVTLKCSWRFCSSYEFHYNHSWTIRFDSDSRHYNCESKYSWTRQNDRLTSISLSKTRRISNILVWMLLPAFFRMSAPISSFSALIRF